MMTRRLLTSSCPSSLRALVFSLVPLFLAQAFWLRALPELLLGLALPAQPSPPAPEQPSAWPPMRSVSQQQPVERARLQRRAHQLPAQLRLPQRSWACVRASWALDLRVLRARLPSSLFHAARVAAVAAVPAENTAPGTLRSPCVTAACHPATAGKLHPISSCIQDAPA